MRVSPSLDIFMATPLDSRNDELEVGELVDVENDPRGVAEEEDEDYAEQDEAQVELPPLPPRRTEALHLIRVVKDFFKVESRIGLVYMWFTRNMNHMGHRAVIFLI